MTNWSWQFGKLAQLENALLRFLRDLAIRAAPDVLHGRQLDRLYSFGS